MIRNAVAASWENAPSASQPRNGMLAVGNGSVVVDATMTNAITVKGNP
jgi:hypothetical protein